MNITVNLTPETGLEQTLKNEGINPALIENLVITGTMTGDDCDYIRENMGKTLHELDMGSASISEFAADTGTDEEDFGTCIGAFMNCTGLTSVIIPDTLIEIGDLAFEGCTGLKSVFIPASTTNIESGALDCEITVHPDNPNYSSEDCVLFNREKTVLKSYPKQKQGDYIIPASVVEIEPQAFCNCLGLTSVTIPDSVTKIPCKTFACCFGLTSVIIPASIINIEEAAFTCCKSLTSVIIPDSVTEIGADAFQSCKKLTSINIPDSVKMIDYSTFSDCTALVSVTVPASVIYIGFGAFKNCTALKSVFIPASTVDIEDTAFKGCKAVITVHPDNPVYTANKSNKLKLKIKNASGHIGAIDWSFSKGVLTISGEGEIPDYYDYFQKSDVSHEGIPPWYHFRRNVKSIVFKGKISINGHHSFAGFNKLSSVSFKDCTIPRICEEEAKYHHIIDRVFQGYTYNDLYDIRYWFEEQMSRMLQDFKRAISIGGCTPGGMEFEEWTAILEQMSFYFSEMYNSEGFTEEERTRRNEMKKKGFELFFKWYGCLWF